MHQSLCCFLHLSPALVRPNPLNHPWRGGEIKSLLQKFAFPVEDKKLCEGLEVVRPTWTPSAEWNDFRGPLHRHMCIKASNETQFPFFYIKKRLGERWLASINHCLLFGNCARDAPDFCSQCPKGRGASLSTAGAFCRNEEYRPFPHSSSGGDLRFRSFAGPSCEAHCWPLRMRSPPFPHLGIKAPRDLYSQRLLLP